MADFQTNSDIQDLGIRVIAASVDSVEDTLSLTTEMGLSNLETATGVDAVDMALKTGAYIDETNAPFLQPTAFVLNPEGTIAQSLYSSGPVSRLRSADVVTLVKLLMRQ